MNKLMENKVETADICQHSQRTRLLREEDEFWISSEDLNTEDSSDEDAKHKFKRKSKRQIKMNKTKSASNLVKLNKPSSSKQNIGEGLTEYLLPNVPKMHDPTDLLKLDIVPSHLQHDDSNMPSDDEAHTSELPRMESWRPVRGSLQLENFHFPEVRQDGFYNDMLQRINSLRCTQDVDVLIEETDKHNEIQQKTFRYLKNTPEVQAMLASIKKMDEDISSQIDLYKSAFPDPLYICLQNKPSKGYCLSSKERVRQESEAIAVLSNIIGETVASRRFIFKDKYEVSYITEIKVERAERLSAQQEMCKELSDNKLSTERNTDLFLDICDYEMESELERRIDEQNDLSDSNHFPTAEEVNNWGYDEFAKDFIKRNKELAKEGVMAGVSLTDEEKSKLKDLLSEAIDAQVPDLSNSVSTVTNNLASNDGDPSTISIDHSIDNMNTTEDHVIDDNADSETNAFSFNQSEKVRITEINNALKIFEDEDTKQVPEGNKLNINDDKFWKQFILELSLKDIDDKLEKLYKSKEREPTLSNSASKSYNTTFEFTEEETINNRDLLKFAVQPDVVAAESVDIESTTTESAFSSEC